MIELLIIADDLTGAMEAGVQLAKQEICSKVIHNPAIDVQKICSEQDISVLVFNSESRHIQPAEAAERIRKVITKAQKVGVKKFYKKTDSTMRGNIGAELKAFIVGTGQRPLAFIPAHPKLLRFTRAGFQYIDEQLLHETEIGKDPLDPMNVSYVPEILSRQTGIAIYTIDVIEEKSITQSDGLLVFDCRAVRDLEAISVCLLKNELHHAIAGSAAMVEFLPQIFQLKPHQLKKPKIHGPILFVNGSLNNTSYEQVKYAMKNGVKTISIPSALLTVSNFRNNQDFLWLRSQIQFAIENREDIILNSTPLDNNFDVSYSKDKNLKPDHFELIAKKIGLIVATIIEEVQLNILAVFGGDTISGVMQALTCEYIEPKDEVLPGVALSLVNINNKDIHLVSKPGGYGDEDVILHILDYIKKSR